MIRISLADDHKLFAKGLEGLLEEHEDLLVMGLYANGKELIDEISTDLPDVVLTDLNMPILDGFGVLEFVKKNHPQIKVVVLSMYDDEKIYKKCLHDGADAFVLRTQILMSLYIPSTKFLKVGICQTLCELFSRQIKAHSLMLSARNLNFPEGKYRSSN